MPKREVSIYGKVPPQSKDLEIDVLGCIMLQDVFFDVQAILKPESFYVDAHQTIFKAMHQIVGRNLKPDVVTVVNELKDMGELENCGGMLGIAKITNGVRSAANIQNHARVIAQKFMLREVIRVSGEAINAAYEDGADAFDVLGTAENEFQAINDHLSFGEMVSADKVMVETVKLLEHYRELYQEHGKIPVTGVPSGIEDLDFITLGWQPGDLVIIGARPSVGKTAFALNLARNAAGFFKSQYAAKKGKFKKVALFSLEMKSSRLMIRLLAREGKVRLHELKSGSLTDADMKQLYSKAINVLSSEGILFDDNSGLTTRKLISKTKLLARKGELGLIVIDYLQLMTAFKNNNNQNREQDMAGISRDLKNIAQEFNVPVIALSQLSREIEKRKEGSAPILSDIRESGAIEQDAELVAFLYGYTEAAIAQDANLKHRRFVKVAKQRDGMLDTIELNADMSLQLFEPLMGSERALSGNFKPVANFHNEPPESEAKLYIQKGSKINGEDEAPF